MPFVRSGSMFTSSGNGVSLGGPIGDNPVLVGAYDSGSKILPSQFRNDGDPLSVADWVERDRAHNPALPGVTSGKSAAVAVKSWQERTSPFVVQWGYSLAMGFPFGVTYSVGYRLAADMGVTLLDLTRGSSVAARDASSGAPPNNSGYASVLQTVTSGMAMEDICYIIELGIGDAVFWLNGTVGATFIAPYGHAIQTMLSRLVADKIWEIGPGATDGELTYTWSGTWASVTDTAANSGAGYRTSAVNASYVETTLPADWGGGTLAIGFTHLGAGNAASWTITLSGANTGTYTFDQLVDDADTGYKNGQVKRLTGLNPGATTVRVTLSSHTGSGGGIDYLQHECDPRVAPEVLVVKQPYVSVSGFAVLSAIAGHTVLPAHFDAANAMLSTVVGIIFGAYPSIHLEENDIHPDEPGMITTLDNLHYSPAAYLSQQETLSRKSQRLIKTRAAQGQGHVLYTRSDSTGLFYGQFNPKTGAWRPSQALTVYSGATPTLFDGCGIADGAQVFTYVPSGGTSVAYKTLLDLFGLGTQGNLSSAAQTVTGLTAGQSPASDRAHVFWQESATPAVRHRSLTTGGTDAAVLSVATDPHATYIGLCRPVGYLDSARQPQMMVAYSGTGPLHRAATFTSSGAPTFTPATVATSPVPGASAAIKLAAYQTDFHALLVENGAALWWNMYRGGAWGAATRLTGALAAVTDMKVYRRPGSRVNSPLVLAVAYSEVSDLTSRYGEWDLAGTETRPAAAPSPMIRVGGTDVSADATEVRWSDTDPGGFESFQARVPANYRVRKGDRITVSVGGSVVWDGHVKDVEPLTFPSAALQIAGAGERTQLADSSLAMLYIDRDMSQWTPPRNARQVVNANASYEVFDGGTFLDLFGNPGLVLEVQGPWGAKMVVESNYDAGAWCRIGKIRAGAVTWSVVVPGAVPLEDALWTNGDIDGKNATEDRYTSWDAVAGSDWQIDFDTPHHLRYGFINWSYKQASGGVTDTMVSGFKLRNMVVVGTHGQWLRLGKGSLPLPGVVTYYTVLANGFENNGLNDGIWASDVVRDAMSRLQASPHRVQATGIVPTSSLVIPHLVYREPTTIEQVVTDMANLTGWHWGVWEPDTWGGPPSFRFAPPPTAATAVCSVEDFSEPPSIAESLDALYNRATVSYRDGSDMEQQVTVTRQVPELDDVAQIRTLRLTLGISSDKIAAAYGRLQLALAEMAARGAGSGTLRTAQTPTGQPLPAWAIRSGRDRIRIVNLPGRTRGPLDPPTRDTFRVVRTETALTADGSLATRIEFDSGANLADVLAARLSVSETARNSAG